MHMTATRLQPKPTFIWQGLFILLPVIVLSVIGWLSLRADKNLAQREAAARAQTSADNLLEKIWSELSILPEPQPGQLLFRIDLQGHLIFPPPFEPVPLPAPLNEAELGPRQAALWSVVQSEGRSPEETIRACEEFLETHPPDRFAALARYNLGLRLSLRHDYTIAAGFFSALLTNHPGVLGESGVPLAPLAQLRLLELARIAPGQILLTNLVTPQSFYVQALEHPTLLTPFLLNLPLGNSGAAAQKLREKYLVLWQTQELCRRLYEEARTLLIPNATRPGLLSTNLTPEVHFPKFLWLSVGSWNGLGIRFDESPTNHLFVFRTENELGHQIAKILEGANPPPDYFGVGVEMGGKMPAPLSRNLRAWQYRHFGGKGGHVDREFATDLGGTANIRATNILASAVKFEGGAEVLRVNVHLTNPAALFENQRSRAMAFGLLIATSAAAALMGLFAAWSAFNRQLRLNEMKSNFVSSVSHELRAPIASVRLLAESLERGKISEPAKQNEYFRFIGQECRRLSALIENVLDFSRIEQGRKQYDFEPTNVTALVDQTVKLMESYAAEKGVRLETSHIQHPTPNIELNVDGRALQQALVNLIDNAIKHSPRDATVTVSLATANADPESPIEDEGRGRGADETSRITHHASRIHLSVTDSGPGIPASEQEKIFERFYRLGSELRRETPGVGIGLSIVKHVVEAHGGRVRVQSEVGKGSRFTIELHGSNAKTQRSQDAEKT
jgi:signal transduction histidine kinase